MKDDYSDIIDLPHFEPVNHPRMPLMDRAAQFAPFAALTGHAAAISETARLTDERIKLDDDMTRELDRRLTILRDRLSEHPRISITCFVPDQKKDGGSFQLYSGRVTKIRDFEREIILEDGTKAALSDILAIEGEIFGDLPL